VLAERSTSLRGNTRSNMLRVVTRSPAYYCGAPAAAGAAPDIVESILDGQQPAPMTLAVLMQPRTVDWDRQRVIGFGSAPLKIE
jgi:hypothetical protein